MLLSSINLDNTHNFVYKGELTFNLVVEYILWTMFLKQDFLETLRDPILIYQKYTYMYIYMHIYIHCNDTWIWFSV